MIPAPPCTECGVDYYVGLVHFLPDGVAKPRVDPNSKLCDRTAAVLWFCYACERIVCFCEDTQQTEDEPDKDA